MTKTISLLAICLAYFSLSEAQTSAKSHFVLGSQIGAGIIRGELTNFGLVPHIGVFAQKTIDKYLQLGIEFNKLQFQGSVLNTAQNPNQNNDWSSGNKNDYKLNASANQIALLVGFDLTPKLLREKNLSFFLNSGFGYIAFSSVSSFLDLRDSIFCNYCSDFSPSANPNYQKHVVETYSENLWSIPLGLGCNYILRKKFLLGLQGQMWYTHSPNLDLINNRPFERGQRDILMNLFIKLGCII